MISYTVRFVCYGIAACLLCLLGHSSLAKPLPTNPEDTIRRFRPRLVLLLTDTSEGAKQARTALFYEQLKNKFYGRTLTRRLFDLLFDAPSASPRPRSRTDQDAIEYFQQFEGKVVAEVILKKLPLFGPNVNDTTRLPKKWYERTGNAIHVNTRDWVIEKHLLFEEGDLIDPEALYDNERLLRSLSYIRDARIRLVPLSDSSDAVAVHVITQDVFPYGFNAGKAEFSSYSLSIQNNNIFGIGHRLITEGLYRSDGSPAMGYAGTYVVENALGSFVNAAISGAYTDVRRGAGLSLQRSFFTPDIRWAGGFDLQRTEQLGYVLHRDYTRDTLVWYSNDRIDLWAAHSVPLNSNKPHPKGRDALVLSGRALRIYHHDTPGGELEKNDFFLNSKLWLGSIGWVRRNYRRDAYIYGFGRTEDVPLGAYANVTYGAEEQQEIMYYGQLSAGWGGYRDGFGYLDTRIAFGQYFGIGERMSRRVRYGSASWISPLIPKGKYRFRQLMRVDYLYGDRRYSYEFISVGDQEVRGIRNVLLRGTQRFNFSFETIAFTPIDIVGFRLSTFAFAEAALLNDSPYLSFSGEALQGYGLGLRVRNENLVFKTFQLRFAYYPGDYGGFSISIKGSPGSGFQDFQLGRPQVHPFR
jgi:hypothetical protein